MRVKIIRKEFSGTEFCPEMRVLHLGGQSSANVERLYFELPEEWQGKSVTLHIQQQDGTLPAPILLDEEHSAAVGKAFTAAKCGSWMLLALGEDGYRALTRPTKYDCYETLATDGDAEISPTQYETFVAQVLAYANSAQSSAKEARNSASAANRAAAVAQMAQNTAQEAAAKAVVAQQSAESDADRAEAAAERAELTAPSDGAVRSVNGKGGVVTLTADDLGAVPEDSGAYVKAVRLVGQTLTLTFGDGSTQTLQTKDTTSLENMTGILAVEHGGTGKDTPMTAADVGAVEEGSAAYVKNVALNGRTLTLTLGSGAQTSYTIPTATANTLGLVKVGENLSVTEDGKLALTKDDIGAALGHAPTRIISSTDAPPSDVSAYPDGTLWITYSATATTASADVAVDDTDIHVPEDETVADDSAATPEDTVQDETAVTETTTVISDDAEPEEG